VASYLNEQKPRPQAALIRKMSIADLPFCSHLVQEAGWNQLDADWLRAMELEPHGCFIAEIGNLPVATTTGCCFGEIGWIAMVLVDKKFRGQGVAESLVGHMIQYMERKGVKTIRLDATSMGQGLYQKLGFHNEYGVIRYEGCTAANIGHSDEVIPVTKDDPLVKMVTKLDHEVTGSERTLFIKHLIRSSPAPIYCKVTSEGGLTGFAGLRKGGKAIQLGPAAALTPAVGIQVLTAAASHFPGQKMYIDIPEKNTAAGLWAEMNGFTEQRRFIRMFRGEKVMDLPHLIWACSGPEKG
jgi:GNAT superfamily N-acetyltransferase